MLFNKGNTRTPFLSMIGGKTKYTNSVEFVLGQEYASEDGDIPNISETASLTAPTPSYITRSQNTNVTQIFQDSVAISYAKMSNMGTLAGANIAGQVANPRVELDFQVGNKMRKIARSIEKTFIQGKYNKATTDAEVNKTRGMDEAIVTNVIDGSSSTLDIWLVNDLLLKIRANGGDISDLVLWLDTVSLNQINGSAVESGVEMGRAYENEYGIQVKDLLLPIGKISLALGEFIPSGTVYAFNFNSINPVEQPVPDKGNFFLEPLAKTGAGETYQLFGQIGLDYGNEILHGKITGLSTEFTKPEGIKVVVAGSSGDSPIMSSLRSISSIEKTGTEGLVDTYTITYSDETTSTFTVTNGEDGDKGETGNGISNVSLDSTNGLVDTYKISFTNGTSTTFDVTNGEDGENGVNGTNGTNGTNGEDGRGIKSITLSGTDMVITYTDDDTDTIDLSGILNLSASDE